MLDMSVRGSYSPYAASYLRREGFYPAVEPEDDAVLHGSTPDFIGINDHASSCVKERTEPIVFGVASRLGVTSSCGGQPEA